MSKDFKMWVVLSIIATVLSELVVYFSISPEYRWTELHHAILWFVFPWPSMMCALLMPGWPEK